MRGGKRSGFVIARWNETRVRNRAGESEGIAFPRRGQGAEPWPGVDCGLLLKTGWGRDQSKGEYK